MLKEQAAADHVAVCSMCSTDAHPSQLLKEQATAEHVAECYNRADSNLQHVLAIVRLSNSLASGSRSYKEQATAWHVTVAIIIATAEHVAVCGMCGT